MRAAGPSGQQWWPVGGAAELSSKPALRYRAVVRMKVPLAAVEGRAWHGPSPNPLWHAPGEPGSH